MPMWKGPHLMHGSVSSPYPQPKRYIDRISHFPEFAVITNGRTDGRTDRRRSSACTNSRFASWRCNAAKSGYESHWAVLEFPYCNHGSCGTPFMAPVTPVDARTQWVVVNAAVSMQLSLMYRRRECPASWLVVRVDVVKRMLIKGHWHV